MQGNFDSNVPGTAALTLKGSSGANGVDATTDHGIAVNGNSDTKIAIAGGTRLGIAVAATAIGSGIGVRANTQSGNAVNAQSASAVAILGTSDGDAGVEGVTNGHAFGVIGRGANAGVAAFNPRNNHAAYLASDCCAAWLTGDVHVTGKLSKGGGGFVIDHPLDPAHKFLAHSFVESPDMKNIYDGFVIADEEGCARIVLPEWFDHLNDSFRYQLCPIGNAAPSLHVAQEVQDGQFGIAGAPPGTRISWQITGIRKDSWALANRIVVEEGKATHEQEAFLHPELYGATVTASIGHVRHSSSSKARTGVE